ncbi:MAG: hypothetical protein CMB46_02215 [Euryarchaeota archaeon]|nr:hypothetical protein [Euryarchaeota archaeon]
MGRRVSKTPPLEKSPPLLTNPSNSAAGLPAIISTMNHGFTKSGIVGSIKTLSRVNRYHGFDCPGCAWPDPDDHRTIAEFCENGAKAVADEATKKRINSDFFSQNSVIELSQNSDQWLNDQGRLTEPMILEEGEDHYKPITWNDAFQLISDELIKLENPNQAIFYTSGRTSNEAAFLWQMLARGFGTNNLPDCSNMCHESSGVALTDSIGIGKGTVTLDDFNKADLILVVGQNPGTNHPRMLTALRDAKRRGGSVISINPLIETGMKKFKHPQNPLEILGSGTEIADDHFQININSDQALFYGINSHLIENEMVDNDFISQYTHGYETFRKSFDGINWKEIEASTGIDESRIRGLAEIIGKAKSVIICWAMGITQHRNSVPTIQEMVNTLLLGGNIGRAGAGVCPVRGHSNVQGDRTVGINHKPSDAFISKLEISTGIKTPKGHGFDAVEAVQAMISGEGKVFLSMGGNFLSAMSDTNLVSDALENCELTVQISTKLNRSHLVTGRKALILPCLGRTEIDQSPLGVQFVSVENSMGIVHSSQGRNKPASKNLLSEPSIVCNLGEKLDLDIDASKIIWNQLSENYDLIRNLIEATIPGFNDYNNRVRIKEGFYLPNPPKDNRIFNTDSGLANFRCNKLDLISADKNEFIMMTIRSHDQYNTTVYSPSDRYRGVKGGRRIIFMNSDDIDSSNLDSNSTVDITSLFKGVERKSKSWHLVPYDIPSGNVATYFPEANELIPLESVAIGSNTPTSKSVRVKITQGN